MHVEDKMSKNYLGMALDRDLKFDERMKQITFNVNNFIGLQIYTYLQDFLEEPKDF